jgi:hypothetical protein
VSSKRDSSPQLFSAELIVSARIIASPLHSIT